MISGIAGYLKEVNPVMSESVKAGRIVEIDVFDTLSDGTAGGIESDSITFEPCSQLVDDWVSVSESEIVTGMRWIFEHHGLKVEGAAAVVIAAYLKQARQLAESCTALVMCGGNIDEDKFKALLN